MAKKSQNEQVLDYLMAYGSITTLEAYERLGITRLSGRIYDLRKEGHDIKGDPVEVETRSGGTTTVTRYYPVVEKQTELQF